MPYFMVFFCAAFLAFSTYEESYIAMTIHLLLSLFWLRQFIRGHKFNRLNGEFKNILEEAEKRIKSGAPARELIEMAHDRLEQMKKL
jgi:Flp pilus assembly protein TadB